MKPSLAARFLIIACTLSFVHPLTAKRISYVSPDDSRFDANGNVIVGAKTITSLNVEELRIPGYRRTIRDVNGKVIAGDQLQSRLAIWMAGAAPAELLNTYAADLKIVNDLLARPIPLHSLPDRELVKRAGTPIVFPQSLTPKEITLLKTLTLPRIRLIEVPTRSYPYKRSLVHALGWATQNKVVDSHYIFNAAIGKSAIERILDKELQADRGNLSVVSDAADFSIKTIDENAPRVKSDLQVTLDAELQRRLDLKLEKLLPQGAVLISDEASGALRVMLSYPSFDPNSLSPYLLKKDEDILKQRADEPLINRIYRNYAVEENFVGDRNFSFKDADDFYNEKLIRGRARLYGEKALSPLYLLSIYQKLRGGLPLNYLIDPASLSEKASPEAVTASEDGFASKVSRINNKALKVEGEIRILPLAKGKYNVLILSEAPCSGGDAKTQLDKIQSIIEREIPQ